MYLIAFFRDEGDKPIPDPQHIYDDERFESHLFCDDLDAVKELMEKYPGRQIILQVERYRWNEELYRGSDYKAAIEAAEADEEKEK